MVKKNSVEFDISFLVTFSQRLTNWLTFQTGFIFYQVESLSCWSFDVTLTAASVASRKHCNFSTSKIYFYSFILNVELFTVRISTGLQNWIFRSNRSSRSHNFRASVRLVLVCLKLSIFIFWAVSGLS